MLSGMYISSFGKYHGGDLDFENDAFSAVLVDTDLYAPNRETDQNIGDIPDGAIIAETLLQGKFVDGLQLHADNAIFPSVPAGDLIARAIVVYRDDVSVSDSALFLLFHEDDVPDLPIVPDGTDITISWHANGMYNGTAV